MTSAYPTKDEKPNVTPEQFVEFRQSLNTRLTQVAFVRTGYGLDRQLGIPVTLMKVLTDTRC